MFRGINAINLDSKGRLGIPTRYREKLQDSVDSQLIITIDTEEKCLLLYPLNEWEKIESKIEALPSFNKAARRVQRLLIGHATELTLDTNGRILLPNLLREYAALEKNIVLVGQGKKFEIWDESIWNKKREEWLEDEAESADILPVDLVSLSL